MGHTCAFTHCANSSYKIARWYKKECRKHRCRRTDRKRCDCQPPFVLFPFPSAKDELERRKIWTRAVFRMDTQSGKNKNWAPNKNSRICSIHFVDGENTIPTLKLGEAGKFIRPVQLRKAPINRDGRVEDSPPARGNAELTEEAQSEIHADHTYIKSCKCDCHHSQVCLCCPKLEEAMNIGDFGEASVPPPSEDTCETGTTRMPTMAFLDSPEKVKLYSGLVSYESFRRLHARCIARGADRMRYWRGTQRSQPTTTRDFKATPKKTGPKRKLTTEDELLMTLMKLRQGFVNEHIALLFGVSDTLVSQVFNTWVKFLSSELAPLIYWPPKEALRENFPKSLPKNYRNLRCTIDCTEILIERPRHLELQAMTWSDYKKHNTVKYLVAIAPNGAISFLSKGWCGRASDRRVTNESGLMDLLEPQDLVLADRGFPIVEDMAKRSVTLEIPPPSSGIEQQTREHVHKTSRVANARIHVERSIGRLKEFSILSGTLPISLVPLIDDIMVVCAAVSNLKEPLVT
jgi:hypothetical protein